MTIVKAEIGVSDDDKFEIPKPNSPFNRDVDVLLMDIAREGQVSGDELEQFWKDLREIMGDRADEYQLKLTKDGAMLVPKPIVEPSVES